MEVKQESMLMSPIRPIRTFSVAILNQRPIEIKAVEMKTTNKSLKIFNTLIL